MKYFFHVVLRQFEMTDLNDSDPQTVGRARTLVSKRVPRLAYRRLKNSLICRALNEMHATKWAS